MARRVPNDGEREPSRAGTGAAGTASIGEDAEDGESVPPPPSAASGEVALTFEQASCLEVNQPVCSACHRRGDGFVLRPLGVPPPPPDTPTVAREECLQPVPATGPGTAIPPVEQPTTPESPIDPAVEHVLSIGQAACLGVDQPVCAGCHIRQGSFLLRPRGLPPHPEDVPILLDRCL